MIRKEDLIEIGRFLKTHGISGEITFEPIYDLNLKDLKCIVVEIDGIHVPFFIDTVRPKGSDALIVRLEGIESDIRASELTNKTVYALTDDIDMTGDEEEGLSALSLVGYTMLDDNRGTEIGIIDHINDMTQNWLFMVLTKTGELKSIPVADEFITSIDPHARSLYVRLPEGLLDI